MGGPAITTVASTPAVPVRMSLVVDYSELNREAQPGGAALLLICRSCHQVFYSDFEEPRCGTCVKLREL